jgi:N-acetylglucosamine-6-phosphate deacetylase
VTTIVGRDPATGDLVRLTCRDGRIESIRRDRDSATGTGWLSPGFVDVQVNGFGGWDVNAPVPSADAIEAITDALAAVGVHQWVPTVITGSEEQIVDRLRAVEAARRRSPAVRAAVPFSHVEGPFLSPLDGPRGAHPLEHVRDVSAAEVARWAEAGRIGYVTLSPHDERAPADIARIVASGIAVAIGHTHADPTAIRAAVDAGATLSTHLGNGIFSTLARHPNPIWTQLADDRLTAGFIGDGHHLPADTLLAMVRAKGRGRCYLVSDSVDLAGKPPGRYARPIGGDVELSDDGRLSMVGADILAGSAVSLADVVRWVVRNVPIPFAQVIDMAATTPAAVIAACGGPRSTGLVVGSPAAALILGDDGSVIENHRAPR